MDEIVKANQIDLSFVIDLNEWNPATVVNIAATVLKTKALKLGNGKFLFFKDTFLKLPFFILSCVLPVVEQLGEVTLESRNGNITGSQKAVTVCSIV